MKTRTIAILAGIFCLSTANGSAHEITFLKALNSVKQELVAPQDVWKAVPRGEVYLPAGTSWVAMERRITAIAEEARLDFSKEDIKALAYTPKLWKSFELEIGHPMFEGRPISHEMGLSVLKRNQARFAKARANNEYEAAWKEFITKRDGTFPPAGKVYEQKEKLGEDLYDFYVQYIGLENIPLIRVMGAPNARGFVLEIPINGLQVSLSGKPAQLISPEKFVFFREDDGILFLFERTVLEQKQEKYRFAVIR